MNKDKEILANEEDLLLKYEAIAEDIKQKQKALADIVEENPELFTKPVKRQPKIEPVRLDEFMLSLKKKKKNK